MPSELRGADNKQLQLRNVSTLRQALGCTSIAEFKAFLASNRFKPYFDEFASQWIIPQQERAQAEGSSRPRGPGLEHVEHRLLSGERPGQDKFCRRPDKSNWDNVDHCALMIFEIREANTKSVEGLFYRTDLSEHDIHLYIWAMVKHQEFNIAPSRKEKETDPMDVDDPNDNVHNPNVFAEGEPGPDHISVGNAVV